MEKALKKFLKDLRLNESTISMVLGGMVVVVVGILIYNYFTTVGKQTDLTGTSGTEGQTELPATHTVAKGEYLWTIAEKYYGSGYGWNDIAKANNLTNPNQLEAGQVLSIPKAEVKLEPTQETLVQSSANVIEGTEYTVQKGDSLWSIAVRAYQDGYKWPKISEASNLPNPNQIEVGMKLVLPR